MGYIEPPYFPYWFIDHWLQDIARLVDRYRYVDLDIDVSPRPGTMEKREVAWWTIFYDCMKLMRRDLAHKIINDPSFKESERRKRYLLTHHPNLEFHSRWINDCARAEEGHVIGPPPDERYLRIKNLAKAMLLEQMPRLEETRAKAA